MYETELNPEAVANRHHNLRMAAGAYDMVEAPGLDHLRPHQLEALHATLDYIEDLSLGDLESSLGAAILLPTGSGKTIEGAAIVTALTTTEFTPTVLYITPSLLIQRDTEEKFQKYAPGTATFTYSSKRGRPDEGTVCLMTAQSLDGAIQNGFINKLNPDMVVSDEGHHMIDGQWAGSIEEIARDRVSICMTATPAYSHERNVRRLFPTVLIHKTLKDGIEDGFVSSFRSRIYASNICYQGDNEGITKDIFSGLGIAAQYAAVGKVGIISCIAGNNRAQARSVESLSRLTKVEGTDRALQVVSIDGTMDGSVVDGRIRALKKGDLDAIAYTNLLGEGVDIPELDYLLMFGWTESIVHAAQRLGRGTRLGKITDIHEFHRPGYVTHLDAYNEGFELDTSGVAEPSSSNAPSNTREITNHPGWLRPDFDEIMNISNRLLADGEVLAPTAEQSSVIGNEVAQPSFDWLTVEQIRAATNQPAEWLGQVLESKGFTGSVVEIGDYSREYFAPEAMQAVLEELNVQPLPEDTHVSVRVAHQNLKSKMGGVGSLTSFMRLLKENDIEPVLYTNEKNEPILGVSIDAMSVVPDLSERALKGLATVASRRSKQAPVKLTLVPDLEVEVVEKPSRTVEQQVEAFLFSLAPPRSETRAQARKRQLLLANFENSLQAAGKIGSSEINTHRERIQKFDPNSIAFRNLVTIGEKMRLSKAQVLAAMMRVMAEFKGYWQE